MFELSDQKKKVLETSGNLLIMGGPGSGKTTIALLKAKSIIEGKLIKKEQRILFLSFARATVSRIEQQLGEFLDKSITKSIEITTYHGFFWTLLKSHGYLLNGTLLKLLPPHELAIRLSGFSSKVDKISESKRLYDEEGLISFDLFAKQSSELLGKSKALAEIITNTYPVIILDEFQDTDPDQWSLVKILAQKCVLITLADPEQRIYDFRGADPARIHQFTSTCQPTIFDFGSENNRSNGTDITKFGNDLLKGTNKGQAYNDVSIYTYNCLKNNVQLIQFKFLLLDRIKFLSDKFGNNNWSIAVLLPSNRLMASVSNILGIRQNLKSGSVCPAIIHDVSVDTAGLSLAALMISRLLEEGSQTQCSANSVIEAVCEYILGHRGSSGTASQVDRDLVEALKTYCSQDINQRSIRGKIRQQLVQECEAISSDCNNISFSGNVSEDWIAVRKTLHGRNSDPVKRILNDTYFIKLMHKGSVLNSGLDKLWRRGNNYSGALQVVQNALLQEHFETSQRKMSGVNVMTIHKAKGKEFDEVIIWEGSFDGERFVYKNEWDKARLNLRVAVTRAKSHTYIFTPSNDRCPLL